MSRQQHFCDRAALDAALATHIADRLTADIERRGRASLAVSGGSTPKGLFAALSRRQLPWQQVCITLVDERWVEPDHPDSNEKLVRDTLLQNSAAAARFVALKGPGTDASAAVAAVTGQLRQFLPLPLTCAVLGMGNDGHTASWFPRAANLATMIDPEGEALLACCDPVTAPHQRITFTLPAILAAGEIILHITGEEKRAVLAAAGDEHYPVAAITDQQDNPASIWWAP